MSLTGRLPASPRSGKGAAAAPRHGPLCRRGWQPVAWAESDQERRTKAPCLAPPSRGPSRALPALARRRPRRHDRSFRSEVRGNAVAGRQDGGVKGGVRAASALPRRSTAGHGCRSGGFRDYRRCIRRGSGRGRARFAGVGGRCGGRRRRHCLCGPCADARRPAWVRAPRAAAMVREPNGGGGRARLSAGGFAAGLPHGAAPRRGQGASARRPLPSGRPRAATSAYACICAFRNAFVRS